VALTLRHDRLDNFWFTLCHELAHIALHFDTNESMAFFDDLDQAELDYCEEEADRWASEVLIPANRWDRADMDRNLSVRKILDFAADIRINPAIPAGRIRKERNDYRIFSRLVGSGTVRKLFA
jgi:HTH-type transcriptional regulator/antitoxin HigA